METEPGQPLELALAQRANDAISKGANPQAVTQRLHDVIGHLRANPDVASDASAALSHGIDPDVIGQRVYQHSLLHAPASRAQADQTVVNPNDNPSLLSQAGHMALSALAQPAESFGKLISPPESEVADLNSESNPSRQALEARFGFAPTFKSVTPSERAWAGAQTAANVAAPFLAKLGAAGTVAAGVAGGAAYSPEHPVRGAITGGFINSLLHIVPEAGEAVASGYKGTPTGPSQNTIDLVMKSLQRDNASIPMLRSTRAMLSDDAPVALPDLAGKNILARAKSAVRVPGSASEDIPSALEQRRQAQPARVASAVDQAFGTAGQNYFTQRQNLINEMGTAATTNYGRAFAHGAVDDPTINAMLEDPAYAKAFSKIAADRAANGNPLPTITREVEQPIVFQGQPLKDPYTGAPRTQKVTQTTTVPDVESLHDLKMMNDKLIGQKGNFDQDVLDRYGIDAKTARNLVAKQADFVKALGTAVPDYDLARTTHADFMNRIRAMTLGRDFAAGEPEEMAATFDKRAATPEAQQDYRLGAARTIKGQVGKVGPTGRAAPDVPTLADNPLAQMRLAKIAPSPDAADQLGTNLAMERVFNNTQRGTLNGSDTTPSALAASELMQPGLSQTLLRLAGGQGKGIVKTVAQKLINQGMLERASNTAGEMAPIFTAGMTGQNSKNALEAVLQMLEESQKNPRGRASAVPLLGPQLVAADNQQQRQ